MSTFCCFCQGVRCVQNIFKQQIGEEPPVLIGEVVQELTRETQFKFDGNSGICRKCSDMVLRWHNALKVARQVQRELLQLLKDTNKVFQYETTQKNDIEDNENRLDDNDEEMEPETETEQFESKTEIKLEFYASDNADPIENDEIDVDPKDMEIKFTKDDVLFEKKKKYSHKLIKKKKNYPKEKTRKAGEDVDIKCSECDQILKSQREYSAHMKKDHSAGFICDQCGKTLQSYSGLTKHILNHNPVKPFECAECGKGFHLQGHLKRHMAEHESGGENIHKCEICARRFYYLYDLQRHQLWHDDSSRQIECEICNSKFRTQPHLKRHMATHTGVKPHRCPTCGKCFAQLYNMRVHHRQHEQPGNSRQRRLKCNNCSRTFTNRENYQLHCKRGECEATSVK